MRLSVVVPAYNAEAFLERAVNSLLASTVRPDEILVIDDASQDGTLALMHRLAGRHPEVRVIAVDENAGPAHARNLGLDAARGTWVAIHDADDLISRGRFAAMLDVAEREAADVVVDNFIFVSAADGSRRPSRIPAGDGWEHVDRHQFFRAARAFNYQPTWALLQPILRREFLETHRLRYPTDSRHGEDYLFMVELLLAGASFIRVRNPGYLYTERAGGFSTTRTDYRTMVEHTKALIADPRLQDDPIARRLLRRRLATLVCMGAERSGPASLAGAVLTSPGVAATLGRRLGRRAGRALRRPPADPLPELL